MRFIDPHIHTHVISDIDLEKLALAGMEAIVIPTPHRLKVYPHQKHSCSYGGDSWALRLKTPRL